MIFGQQRGSFVSRLSGFRSRFSGFNCQYSVFGSRVGVRSRSLSKKTILSATRPFCFSFSILGFRVSGSPFSVFRFRFSILGFRVSGPDRRARRKGCRRRGPAQTPLRHAPVSACVFVFQVSIFGFQGSSFRFQISGFGLQFAGFGSRVPGFG